MRFLKGCLIGFSIGTLLALLWVYTSPPKVEPQEEFIACMSFGCTYCAEMKQTPCGINLSKCADTKTYFCMHDLSYKEVP